MSDDRTVYARGMDVEIVRYDRAGKWYEEHATLPRRHIAIREAVSLARLIHDGGGELFLDRPGGMMFDSLYRKG